jgi:hypothetical protein
MDVADAFVRLLESVAAGTVSVQEAVRSWGSPDSLPRSRALDRGWEALMHYAADEDIRERDPDYAAYQIRELQASAEEIRAEYGLPK